MTPPPESGYPTKLVSPSKKKPLIPKAPDLRPSLDAFWNPEVINDWTDRHSPAKKLVSPKKQQWREDVTRKMGGMDLEDSSSSCEESASPISKPKLKIPQSKSPEKKCATAAAPSVKEARMRRKNFADRKDDIATSFLAELDTKSSSNPPVHTTEVRHHCSIELASKVIDDDERLFNVLAHEFCHLLTFMISEVRNNPHGAEFKAWGRKVSTAFANRGVEVTTKHSYAIEYKFVWECVSCGYEFKRHSRSVDTTRHSCGKCKGKLVQTKPVPRNGGAGKNGEGAKQSEYQVFVKENFKKVKAEMALQGLDTQMGKVMEVVAKQYRERKKEKEGTSVKAVDTLDDALKELKL